MSNSESIDNKYAIAVLDSGNYALNLLNILEKKNFFFEFVSIPCGIAASGCGYCIKFPLKYMDIIIKTGKESGLLIREIYEIIPQFLKNKYKKVYENYQDVRRKQGIM
jgi:hypothetical protein